MNQLRASLCGIRNQTPNLSIGLLSSFNDRLAGFSSNTRSSFGGFMLPVNGRPASRLHRPVVDGTARFYPAPERVCAHQASARMSSPTVSFLSISGLSISGLSISGGKPTARYAAPW